MNKILIVKTSSLGDIIHTYPILNYLHHKFPLSQIDWVIEETFADLVRTHPLVNKTITISTKQWRKNPFSRETLKSFQNFRAELRSSEYEIVFDLQGNIKSGLIVSQVRSLNKVGFGKKSVPEWPNLIFTNHHFDVPVGYNIRQDYLLLVASFFNESPIYQTINETALRISTKQRTELDQLFITKPSVLVCAGSAWKNKQLCEETLKDFLKLLQEFLYCSFLFIWGSDKEKLVAQELHQEFLDSSQIVDKMPLPMLQNLMDMCDLVIAMDSLPLHLAGTTKTPSFSIFGASLAAKYKPLGNAHYAYQGSCPYGKTFKKRCPILRTCTTGACIRNLKALELFESFKSWWNNKNI
jgi:heptosyltransferase-1